MITQAKFKFRKNKGSMLCIYRTKKLRVRDSLEGRERKKITIKN